MIVELVCVGSELLSGITLNSNAHWLAGQIAQSGGILRRVTVVKDDLGEISSAVRESLARSPDLLITTGGLGATYDDMTLEAVAEALGRKTSVDQNAVEMLKRSYARRGLDYELNEVRLKMATIPDGAAPLENMVGSAPAVKIELEKSSIFCLQGVPGEMQQIFNDYILPAIKKKVGRFFSKEVNCMVRGVTESMIAPALLRIIDSNPGEALYLKTHPQGYGENNVPQIRAQVVTRGTDEDDVAKRLDAVVATLQQEISKLGGKIVS
ncbi:MAG TPA: molybdopterin-binding protein [Nitrososphaera sp.]|jgi:molybdenum cofactor synthesis domain-containing protein|nr:molybdopterin-binding protein [Nitrososphaera sp.]